MAEVDNHPCPGDHLDGIKGAAHGTDAANSFHDLGEVDLRRRTEPEAEGRSPSRFVGGASAPDQRLARRTTEVDARTAGQPLLRHRDAVSACCGRQRGDQPGWTSAEHHEIVVAAGRVLPRRGMTLVDRALVVFVRGY